MRRLLLVVMLIAAGTLSATPVQAFHGRGRCATCGGYGGYRTVRGYRAPGYGGSGYRAYGYGGHGVHGYAGYGYGGYPSYGYGGYRGYGLGYGGFN